MSSRTFRTFLVHLIVVLVPLLVFAPGAGASIGFKDFEVNARNEDGSPDVQAGSHPWEMTLPNFDFERNEAGGLDEDLKDVEFELPAGLLGDARAMPQCSIAQFSAKRGSQLPGSSFEFGGTDCPDSTQVGIAVFKTGPAAESADGRFGLYNLVPPAGVPAEFGVDVVGIHIIFQASVRTGTDNGITVSVHNANQFLRVFGTNITVWGVPGDPSHDDLRGECLGHFGESLCSHPDPAAAQAFLTLPTSCATTPPVARIRADSWQNPGDFVEDEAPANVDSGGDPLLVTGCDALTFQPAIAIAPDTSKADTPAGLSAEVTVPQEGLTNAEGLAPATLKNTTVTLPEGLVINPGQAAGLVACQPGEDSIGTEEAPNCPAGSKVGTVAITTPLLPDKLEGNVYILPGNPPDLRLLAAASADGVNLKLIGNVHLDAATGRLTTTFANTPSLPFTDFKLSFSGGAQAALATPTGCGQYTSNVDFTPWSSPLTPDVLDASTFEITGGPAGAPCAAPLPFTPTMQAGATTDQAGGFTNFSLLLQRADGQQRIEKLQFKTPAGLEAMIAGVPLCGEAAANAGTCSPASQIGHTIVASGPGPFPLIVPEPGKREAPIYLTAGYHGAPYGLSIAVPVEPGPFVLNEGRPVVVRSSIAVDPSTAQLTITTDPLPKVLNGVPTDLRTVNAVIDRPGFMFNPTNCNPGSFSGSATSYEGTTAPLRSHFQVGSCRSLTFKPGFKVSTAGKTSKANGASLTAKVTYPPVPVEANQAAGQANIASVKVDLPKQLPSRLTTLQKACTAAQFAANPAGCPVASVVGHATAITPVLPVPLTGPAYFVSHGGEAFPSLIIVLQGYGVTVDLVASTFISKAGITSSTFKQVPDVPFSTFTLTLPEGKFSALAANGNLCKSKLAMPTAFVAQNGAEIHESTKISATGCPSARPKLKKAKAKAKAKRGGKQGKRPTTKGER